MQTGYPFLAAQTEYMTNDYANLSISNHNTSVMNAMSTKRRGICDEMLFYLNATLIFSYSDPFVLQAKAKNKQKLIF